MTPKTKTSAKVNFKVPINDGIEGLHAAAPTESRMTELPQIKQPKINEQMPDQATAAYETKPKPILQPQFPSCGRPENIGWVHGHGQCAH